MWRLAMAILLGCGRIAFAPQPDAIGSADVGGDAAEPVAGGCGFVELAPAAGHMCARRADGSVYCWGDNFYGELGDGTLTPHYTPAPIAATGFTSVARGDQNTTCGIKEDTTVWCWGRSQNSVLGFVGMSATPVQIQLAGAPFDRAIEVEVGEHHACARRDDRSVWCWGWNMYGQTGVAAGADVVEPVQVSTIAADELAIGYATSCARIADRVECWGWNMWGQLGDGTDPTSRETPGLVQLGGLPLAGVRSIAAGYLHVCATNAGGDVACWGTGQELGNPTNGGATASGALLAYDMTTSQPIANVSAVASGDRFTCALRDDTSVWCWGANDVGQLGDGTQSARVPAMPVLVSTGVGLTEVLRLAVGNQFACALRAGDVQCWGTNNTGQLGVGGNGDIHVFAAPIVCP